MKLDCAEIIAVKFLLPATCGGLRGTLLHCALVEMQRLFALPLQAFLELNSEECAQTMVNYYSSVTPYIRNHPIYMQYSTHKELKTDNSPNQVVRAPSQTLVKDSLLLITGYSFTV